MRNAFAGIAIVALVAGIAAWPEPARATMARRKASPSFFREYHASFQGAMVTTTGSGTVDRRDGWIIVESGTTPASTCLVKGSPAAYFSKLSKEGASLSLFAWRNAGGTPTTETAVARVLAGGTLGGVRRGFGFKWVQDRLFGITCDNSGVEAEVKLGTAGVNDLLALVGPTDVEFYVDGVAAGSLPISSTIWGEGNLYEISVTNGTMSQNYGFNFHSLKMEAPHSW